MNTTQKGNRADLECRKMFEALGYETEKARVSRGAFDFVGRRADFIRIGTRWNSPEGKLCKTLGFTDVFHRALPDLVYAQVKCNAVGDARHKFQAAWDKGQLREGLCLIAVRKDGRGRNPPQWSFEVWRPNV